ncbi:MAG: S26 family signal peptidase [Caulobacteraceae bacterium]|nr:S26 family signal peptidase [Caulobacteraceae bacterium]
MTWTPLDTGNRWAVLGVALTALALAAAVTRAGEALAGEPWALVNESPSLPRGLYARAPGAAPVRGAVVAVPQPPAARAYLGALGMPAEVLLIKRVAASPGQSVCRQGAVVVAHGRTAAVLERDRYGRRLPGWGGCRRLGPNELFLLGDTPTSFDSRYFGPVDRRDIVGVYRGVATW